MLVDEHFGGFPAVSFSPTGDNQSVASLSTVNVKSAPSALAAVVVTPASGGGGLTIERTLPLDGGLASGRIELEYDVAGTATLEVTPANGGSPPSPLDIPVLADVDRVRILCGIDFASGADAPDATAAPPVTVAVWVDDVVLRRCSL